MNLKFQNDDMLWLIFLPAAIGALYYVSSHASRSALKRFAAAGLLPELASAVNPAAKWWKAFLVMTGILSLSIALARPTWGERKRIVERRGRDVVFVLDVSRSMLAADLNPNRLEHAKNAIRDCLDSLTGDRVGLVVFAGGTVVKCPLTTDYGFFRMMLTDASPESVGRGGTLIGDAIRQCVEDVFDEQRRDVRDIVLITDGDDHESFPIEAAARAGKEGIRLIAIGIGDENEGRRIPITDAYGRQTYLKNAAGEEVWSKLKANTLRDMVDSTPGGQYLNVSTGTLDMGKVYLDLIASAERKKMADEEIVKHQERFQIFLIAAFALLLLEPIVSERKRRVKV